MSMLTPDKITEIFCIADDFCKEFAQEVKKHQLRPDDVIHWVTGIKSNMKNRLYSIDYK